MSPFSGFFVKFANYFAFMKNNFVWNSENVAMPALDFPIVQKWIGDVASLHGRILGDVAYIFCDDQKILEVNRQFLGHDYFTDIITFDYSRGKLISGDMFISLDTVRSNAGMIGDSYSRELFRVIIHGILHLCGINDKGPGEREIMESNENQALALILK